MSRNKDPAVLFYTSDFLSGVSDLTMEERGQYITLLCLQHQKGHLSMKQIKLAVGKPTDDVLAKFIKDAKGKYYHDRMEEEIIKRQKFHQRQQGNGEKGGRPKIENGNPWVNPRDNPRDNPWVNPRGNPLENENINIDKSNTDINNNIFSFSNNNNKNSMCNSACAHDKKYENIDLEIMAYFDKHNYCSNAEDFIAYNKSREWKGIGGEDVREDFTRYADRWEGEERRKRGEYDWNPPII